MRTYGLLTPKVSGIVGNVMSNEQAKSNRSSYCKIFPSGNNTTRFIPSFPRYSFNFILSGFDFIIECKKDGFGLVFFGFGSIRFSLMINTFPLPLGYIFVDSVITCGSFLVVVSLFS